MNSTGIFYFIFFVSTIPISFIALSMVRGLITQLTEPNRAGSTLVVNHASSLITFTLSLPAGGHNLNITKRKPSVWDDVWPM